MAETILLTGATGTLGRAVTTELAERSADVRVLSRRPAPPGSPAGSWATADLLSGEGLDAALDGVGTVIHLASSQRGDTAGTASLIEAASRSTRPHVIYMSIAGIEDVPFPYYKAKLASERLLTESGLPWTIQRSTQFHDLVAGLFAAQKSLPMLIAPAIAIQPIDVTEVAPTLVELALGVAAGRVPDLGGPEILSARELAERWLAADGSGRRIRSLRLPGKTFRAFASGAILLPERRTGTITFADYLVNREKRSAL